MDACKALHLKATGARPSYLPLLHSSAGGWTRLASQKACAGTDRHPFLNAGIASAECWLYASHSPVATPGSPRPSSKAEAIGVLERLSTETSLKGCDAWFQILRCLYESACFFRPNAVTCFGPAPGYLGYLTTTK